MVYKIYLLLQPDSTDVVEEGDFYDTLHLIKTMNLANVVHSLVFARTEDYLRQNVAVEFWSYFEQPADSNDGFLKFYRAVEFLYKCYFQFSSSMAKLDLLQRDMKLSNSVYNEKSALDAFKLSMRAALLSQLPISHKTIIENFYKTALRKEENKNGDEVCKVCLLNIDECTCLQNFDLTNR